MEMLIQVWEKNTKPEMVRVEGAAFSIGRGSRIHAEVSRKGNQIWVNDLKKTDETFVNGVRILESAEIHVGDTLQVGDIFLRIVSTATLPPPLPVGDSLTGWPEFAPV